MTQPDFSGTFEGRFVDDDNLRESGRVWLEFDNGGGEMSLPIDPESTNAALAEISAAGDNAVQAIGMEVTRAEDAADRAKDSKESAADSASAAATNATNAASSEQAAEGFASSALNAATSAATSASKADSYTPRVEALEAMAGLSPESPVDGQTANLVLQADSLTREAIASTASEVVDDATVSHLGLPARLPAQSVRWIDTMAPGHGWEIVGTAGTVTDDTTVHAFGTQSLHLDGSAAQKSFAPINLRENNLGILLKVPESGTMPRVMVRVSETPDLASSMTVLATLDVEGSPWQRHGEWVYATIAAFTNVLGAPDRESIRAIRITVTGQAWIQALGLTPATPGSISISFDDGYASVLEAARKSMSPRGMAGTLYEIPSLVGDVSGGFMTLAQVKELHDLHRWDIQCHTKTYYSYGGDNSALIAEMREARKFVIENGLGDGAHFAWAGGQSGPDVEIEAAKLFTSSRTVSSMSSESIPPSRPQRMRAYSSIGGVGGVTVAGTKDLVDKCKTHGGWLHLVFHRITDSPAGPNDCTWANFEEILSYIYDSGVPVRTVSEALSPQNTAETWRGVAPWSPSPAVIGMVDEVLGGWQKITRTSGSAALINLGTRVNIPDPGEVRITYRSASAADSTTFDREFIGSGQISLTWAGGVVTETLTITPALKEIRVKNVPLDMTITVERI